MSEHKPNATGMLCSCGLPMYGSNEHVQRLAVDMAEKAARIAELEQTLANVRESHKFQYDQKHEAEAMLEQAEAQVAALRDALDKSLLASCLGCARGDGRHWHICTEIRAALAAPSGR